MSGPFAWWANRKSRIGASYAAIKPPHAHGREWWTSPPTAMPQPEHIEYVVQYQLEVLRMPGSEEKNALLGHIKAWMRAARRLMHEEGRVVRPDLKTTDGLLLAALGTIHKLSGLVYAAGVKIPDHVQEVEEALDARCSRIRRDRAVQSSKTVSRPYWKDDGGSP